MIPQPESDARSDSTALVVALGGVVCPVPFLMSAAAMRMAGDSRQRKRSRQARAAYWIGLVTIPLHVALIAWLVVRAV